MKWYLEMSLALQGVLQTPQETHEHALDGEAQTVALE